MRVQNVLIFRSRSDTYQGSHSFYQIFVFASCIATRWAFGMRAWYDFLVVFGFKPERVRALLAIRKIHGTKRAGRQTGSLISENYNDEKMTVMKKSREPKTQAPRLLLH